MGISRAIGALFWLALDLPALVVVVCGGGGRIDFFIMQTGGCMYLTAPLCDHRDLRQFIFDIGELSVHQWSHGLGCAIPSQLAR